VKWADVGTEVEISGYPPQRYAKRDHDAYFDENYMIEE
jgi:hypothetical protein